jgi:DtxR family transcriptional regulator, Mn-dependent transcriptional regulator
LTSEELSPALGRYLETIFYLVAEGENPRPTRIAEWMGLSKPTVTGGLHRLAEAGLLASDTRSPKLTKAGRTRAERIVRTHRILERWLTDELGLDWLQADIEAGRLEHAVSDDVAERIFERLHQPTTCPHGNPIPGADFRPRTERPLVALAPGERSQVRRISEATEHETPTLLRFLSDHGIGLDVEVEMVGLDAGSGVVTVAVGRERIAMAEPLAEKIWVDEQPSKA